MSGTSGTHDSVTEPSIEPFADNWAYLRTELNWLDRMLALAVARQKKEAKEMGPVARSSADRATSHWWKGLVNLEGIVAGDGSIDPSRRKSPGKNNYQQQLEAKVRATQRQGIVLGVPALVQQLKLSTFEKNVVLMALAPEVNCRYGQLYDYLQETARTQAKGLPTVDLLLRLLCRNDTEWRIGRQQLAATAPLVRCGLVEIAGESPAPLLTRPVKLTDAWVDYLLAEQPDVHVLETMLHRPANLLSTWVLPLPDRPLWPQLVLPDAILHQLAHWCDRVQKLPMLTSEGDGLEEGGTIVLWLGAAGTGKTIAARALAQRLQTPLICLDLAQINPQQHPAILRSLLETQPTLLWIRSAQQWFGRTPTLPSWDVAHFWADRMAQSGLLLLTVEYGQQLQPQWRHRLWDWCELPMPNVESRKRLWKQALANRTGLAKGIKWQTLAQRSLTGGEIWAIAHDAEIAAAAETPPAKVGMQHLSQACDRYQQMRRI